jgi:hypothetical protein
LLREHARTIVNNEAVTPADSTSAAYCNVWDFGTLRWQLSNKYYTDCRNGWKGRDVNSWALFGRGARGKQMSAHESRAEVALQGRRCPF